MLNQSKNIFIVGIKGAAMANLAVILRKMGKNVTGSDVDEEFITDQLLAKNNIRYTTGFNLKDIAENIDLVTYSAAHGGENNSQVIAAGKLGIRTVHQAELLGELLKLFHTTIAVCGCHGKTTTSSLLSYALIKLGAKPSYLVGTSDFNKYPGGDYNGQDFFVIEADEYGVNPPSDKTPKFNFLNPDYVLCNNIDFDHPDVYQNLRETKQAFINFFKNKKLIACMDDLDLMQSINQLHSAASRAKTQAAKTYGFAKNSDLRIDRYQPRASGSGFDLYYNNKSLGSFEISIYGEKNVSNAAGVILTLLELGFKPDDIRGAIKDFSGAKRRFEKIHTNKDVYLFDDYAHHPNEIEATINAARNRLPETEIVVIFQPHTYSRTQSLLGEFAKKLSLADKAFIMPIFPSAREDSSAFTITSQDIVRHGNSGKLISVADKDELFKHLKSGLKPHQAIITMGAGDIYKLSAGIIKIINFL